MKFKSILLLFIFYHLAFLSQSQSVHDNTIYIFTRSTQLKVSYIATDFNLTDSLSTHVGIGLKINNEYQIYNVTNEPTYTDSALVCDDLNSFLNVEGIQYYSLWAFKASPKEMEILISVLREYTLTPVTFDYNFLLEKNNALYCSEFVRNVLEKIDSKKFSFEPIKKQLNTFYQVALSRVDLNYIPVDFFIEFKDFKLVENKYYQEKLSFHK